ncbi:MAG: glycosyltransferase family 2 protein [Spirosomataceae bacterium]
MMNRISIAVPVYNQASTIEKTIESLLKQEVAPYEIVVSENHSTDGTKEILEKFGDKIRIVRPESHLGMAQNWNFCVSQCSGEWVGMCSGDDLLLPNYIKEVHSASQNCTPETVFILGGWRVDNKILNEVSNRFVLSMGKQTKGLKALRLFLESPRASFAAYCFKRETFIKIGGFNTDYYLYQDWIFQFQIAMHGDFYNIKKVIAQYNIVERVEISRQRMYLHVKDILLFISDTIWEAVPMGVNKRTVERQIKKHLKNLLFYLLRNKVELKIEERNTLKSISVKVSSFDLYENWEKGIITNPSESFFSIAIKNTRQKVRNVIQYLVG